MEFSKEFVEKVLSAYPISTCGREINTQFQDLMDKGDTNLGYWLEYYYKYLEVITPERVLSELDSGSDKNLKALANRIIARKEVLEDWNKIYSQVLSNKLSKIFTK